MKRDSFYSRYVSTHYGFVEGPSHQKYRKRYYVWKSYLESLLPSDKNATILEVGAGVGHNMYSLKALGYAKILGTDYSKECVSLCKKKGLTCVFVDSRTENKFYQAHRHAFDMVLLYDVLEHYAPDDAKVLLNLLKITLKPGGFILLSLPNANHPLSNALLFADITHKFIYNEMSLSQLLRNCGFFHSTFLQINSYTLYDDNVFKKAMKQIFLRPFSLLGEFFWKTIALTQGIILSQCKPTLIAIARQ